MARLLPYVNFPGTTRDAMTFYQSVFGGDLSIATFSEFGAVPANSEFADNVMHSQLVGDAITFMAADNVEGMSPAPFQVGNNINMSVVGPEGDQLRAWFDALAEGGTIGMPLQVQVWGDEYGALVDKFGLNWMFNIERAAEEVAQSA